MSQYNKACIFCKTKIQMSDRSGKWLPYLPNGSLHECKSKREDDAKVNETAKKIQTENLRTSLTVEQVIKRLKSMGITIDLELLMMEKD